MPDASASRSVRGVFRPLSPPQLTIDIAAAVLFALLALPIELIVAAPAEGVAHVLGAVTICVVFGAALAVRRLSPALALAGAWVAAVSQMALGRPPSFADIAIFGVLYVTAAYGSTRVYWSGLASALVGAVVITAYLLFGPLFPAVAVSWHTIPVALMMLVAATFALGLAWTVGALVRSIGRGRETRRAQVRAEAEANAEAERVRIARDMHDVVAHSLAVVIAQADGARYALGPAAAPQPTVDALATISSTARAALADVRLLLTQLRHRETAGPQPTLADLEELYAHVRASGVDLRITVDPTPPGTPPAAIQLAVYRILQEALTNAIRHGEPAVALELAWLPDRVDLVVRNPMRANSDGPTRTGHGLIGMTERAHLVGGILTASADGGAFVVRASLPVGGRGTTGGAA